MLDIGYAGAAPSRPVTGDEAQRVEFGKRLRRARVTAEKSQREVAELVTATGYEVSRQAVGGWEVGEYAPPATVVDTLEKALGCEGELFDALGLRYGERLADELARRIGEMAAAQGQTFTSAELAGVFDRLIAIESKLAELDVRQAEQADAFRRLADEIAAQPQPARRRR